MALSVTWPCARNFDDILSPFSYQFQLPKSGIFSGSREVRKRLPEISTVPASDTVTSVALTLVALRRAAALPSLEAALDQDFRVAARVSRGTEVIEGIRAQVIDKDRTPHWVPDTLEQVGWGAVEAHFAPLGANELGLG